MFLEMSLYAETKYHLDHYRYGIYKNYGGIVITVLNSKDHRKD